MRFSRWLAPILVAGGLLVTASAGTARADDQPTGIHVRGQGVISAAPDIANVELGASVRRERALDAYQRAEQLVANLTAALTASGIADKDIQTRQFNINPEYGRSNDNTPPPIAGWRVVHTVGVKLRDLTRIGDVIDSAVKSLEGEGVVQGLSFAIEDTDALAAQARAAAMADARRKAEDYAARAGVRVGRVLLIEEVSAPAATKSAPVAAPSANLGIAQRAEISPGELDVTVIVNVVYEIQ